MKTLKKTLLCALNDDERRTYGIKLATTLEDMETVEGEKKRQTDHFKDRIAGLQASADELRRKVSTGQEWRDVDCVVTFGEPMPDRKTITRTDTGEVVGIHPMTEEDRQLVLPIEQDLEGEAVEIEAEVVEPEEDEETPTDEGGSTASDMPKKKRGKAKFAADPMPADDDEAPAPAGDDY